VLGGNTMHPAYRATKAVRVVRCGMPLRFSGRGPPPPLSSCVARRPEGWSSQGAIKPSLITAPGWLLWWLWARAEQPNMQPAPPARAAAPHRAAPHIAGPSKPEA
jgi:hypothetical protein